MWIEKQRHILDFTLSSLSRRKGKNLALIAVYVLTVSILGSVMFYAAAMQREAALLLKDTPEIVVQRTVAGRHDLMPVSQAQQISQIRGVAAVKGRLWGYYYDPTVKANYTLMVPDSLSLSDDEIIVGQSLARVRQLTKGSRLWFITHDQQQVPFRVFDILAPEAELISADLILIPERGFRQLFGISSQYATDLTVKVRNPKEILTIAAKIKQILPDSRPITRAEILRTYDAVFDWRGGLVLLALVGAVLAFLIFAWDKAGGLSAEEKREIGILKAIGWETGDVLQMKFWEGLAISLTSFLLGVLLAYLHIFFTSAALLSPIIKGWSVIYPDFRLTPLVSGVQLATLFFFTVIPYTVATIVPAWRAATIDPDTVMRNG